MNDRLTIKRLDASAVDFDNDLLKALAYDAVSDAEIHDRVKRIIEDVRVGGDQAVIRLTQQFDHFESSSINDLELSADALRAAFEQLPKVMAEALKRSAQRIRTYAEHQKLSSWRLTEADGTVLGQNVTPLTGSVFMSRVARPPIPHRS